MGFLSQELHGLQFLKSIGFLKGFVVMSTSQPIIIALPSGRIQDAIVDLLKGAGIGLNFGHDKRSLFPSSSPAECGFQFIVLRPQDATGMLERGDICAAFLGADMVEEYQVEKYGSVQLDTGLSTVKLAAAVPHDRLQAIKESLQRGETVRVATKYPRCTTNWAKSRDFAVDIFPVCGSVEAFTRLGYDMIVDVVDSGQTLAANSLEIIESIKDTSTCLAVGHACKDEARLQSLLYSLKAVLRARGRFLLDVNVESSKREAVLAVLEPEALSSVNEVPAANGSITFHLAVRRERLFDAIRRAREAGATGELVQPVLFLGD